MGALELKRKLIDLGAKVETLNGGEPIDVMKHLGQRNGYTSVVWRAGCWGNRGVQSILAGAFQWVRRLACVKLFLCNMNLTSLSTLMKYFRFRLTLLWTHLVVNFGNSCSPSELFKVPVVMRAR